MEEKMTVTLLPARKKASLVKRDEENSELRRAAYCRFSTDSTNRKPVMMDKLLTIL
jgi:site-specific DNA recombinase